MKKKTKKTETPNENDPSPLIKTQTSEGPIFPRLIVS
jgi:hypothetical protein